MTDSDSICFDNDCMFQNTHHSESRYCECCQKEYHDACIDEQGLECHDLADTGYGYFQDNDVFFCSIGCSITYLSWFLGQEQKIKHKLRQDNEKWDAFYEYKYNFVNPKKCKFNRAQMARLEARKGAFSGKSDEEKVERIYDMKVNSITHENIPLRSLVQNQNSTYGRRIDFIQNEFLDELNEFKSEQRYENIGKRQDLKEKLKKNRVKESARSTKAIRRQRAEKMIDNIY